MGRSREVLMSDPDPAPVHAYMFGSAQTLGPRLDVAARNLEAGLAGLEALLHNEPVQRERLRGVQQSYWELSVL